MVPTSTVVCVRRNVSPLSGSGPLLASRVPNPSAFSIACSIDFVELQVIFFFAINVLLRIERSLHAALEPVQRRCACSGRAYRPNLGVVPAIANAHRMPVAARCPTGAGRTYRSGRPVPEHAPQNDDTGVSQIARTETFASVPICSDWMAYIAPD
jgi:hypothetical protein